MVTGDSTDFDERESDEDGGNGVIRVTVMIAANDLNDVGQSNRSSDNYS